MSAIINGLSTGLFLQLAVGPVFFFVANLALQRSAWDGFAGVLGVTLADGLYITLAILGAGKLLERERVKAAFAVIGAGLLFAFGIIIVSGVMRGQGAIPLATVNTANLLASFLSAFSLTLSNPMTIVFFVSLFAVKAAKHRYARKDVFFFGLGTGLATFVFMGGAVCLFTFIKASVPDALVQILNLFVGLLLIVYGSAGLGGLARDKMTALFSRC